MVAWDTILVCLCQVRPHLFLKNYSKPAKLQTTNLPMTTSKVGKYIYMVQFYVIISVQRYKKLELYKSSQGFVLNICHLKKVCDRKSNNLVHDSIIKTLYQTENNLLIHWNKNTKAINLAEYWHVEWADRTDGLVFWQFVEHGYWGELYDVFDRPAKCAVGQCLFREQL